MRDGSLWGKRLINQLNDLIFDESLQNYKVWKGTPRNWKCSAKSNQNLIVLFTIFFMNPIESFTMKLFCITGEIFIIQSLYHTSWLSYMGSINLPVSWILGKAIHNFEMLGSKIFYFHTNIDVGTLLHLFKIYSLLKLL